MTKQGDVGIRVLVIDDYTTMRSIVRYQLNEMGIEDIIEAANGKQALAKLADPNMPNPDIILCDLHMDEMDGLQFCNAIRHDKELKALGIPIIIVTADTEKLAHEVARQVGARAVLTKPFPTGTLQKHLSRAVGFLVGETVV
jgi:CheY-like chemotaxis protein